MINVKSNSVSFHCLNHHMCPCIELQILVKHFGNSVKCFRQVKKFKSMMCFLSSPGTPHMSMYRVANLEKHFGNSVTSFRQTINTKASSLPSHCLACPSNASFSEVHFLHVNYLFITSNHLFSICSQVHVYPCAVNSMHYSDDDGPKFINYLDKYFLY